MNDKVSKDDIISSLFWKFIEQGGTQGVSFIVSIILVRLLTPTDFGLVAIVMTFITIGNVIIQDGFNNALIQKKDINEIDFSTVFYINLFTAFIIYVVLFISAPVISRFFNEPLLISIIRVFSITLFLGSFNSIQNAIIVRKMQFKKLFHSSLGAIVISGTIAIIMANTGFGIWTLVFQEIIRQMSISVIMIKTVKWKPSFKFSTNSAKTLFSYGYKILISNLLGTLFLQIRNIIIGKIYNSKILGYYNKGTYFPITIINFINSSIQSVMFPSFSLEQDNRVKLKSMVRRSIITSCFIVFPTMIGLFVISESLVLLVLTEEWLPCVPFLQIYCIIYALMPIHANNLQVIKALGYSETILKLEIIKKIIDTIVLVVSISFGLYAIAFGELITSIISAIINSYPNKIHLNYEFKEQFMDVLPSLLLSLLMGIVVYSIKFLGFSLLLTLVIQIAAGVFVYFMLAWILKLDCFTYLIETIKGVLNR